jgi:uncharacterized zinc-type alcohol dehydrogenase-like protein
MVKAYATQEPGAPFELFEFQHGSLGVDEVEVAVESCGLYYSDVSMAENHWGMTSYPFVPGHEVIGKIVAVGEHVRSRKVGDLVGVGWFSQSCMTCGTCMQGDHNLCAGAQGVLIGRHGGFAQSIRVHHAWAVPLPVSLDASRAGPLFCGGITVFNPILEFGVLPTDRVGVIGIGGLGHMAIQFLKHWGCEITAFSSTPDKQEQAAAFGAHHFVSSQDSAALNKIAGSLDFIISTVHADLAWEQFVLALKPKGRLHVVGAAPSPISVGVFPLLSGQKSISASPLGSPATIEKMLDFAARHTIAPTVEFFRFAQVNEAFEHLKAGRARYRVVLQGGL